MLAVLFADNAGRLVRACLVYADPATYREGRRRPVWIGVFLPVQCVIGALIRPTDRAVAKGCGAMVTPASSLDPAADETGSVPQPLRLVSTRAPSFRALRPVWSRNSPDLRANQPGEYQSRGEHQPRVEIPGPSTAMIGRQQRSTGYDLRRIAGRTVNSEHRFSPTGVGSRLASPYVIGGLHRSGGSCIRSFDGCDECADDAKDRKGEPDPEACSWPWPNVCVTRSQGSAPGFTHDRSASGAQRHPNRVIRGRLAESSVSSPGTNAPGWQRWLRLAGVPEQVGEPRAWLWTRRRAMPCGPSRGRSLPGLAVWRR